MNSRPVKRVEDVCRLRAAQFSEDSGECVALGAAAAGGGGRAALRRWSGSCGCARRPPEGHGACVRGRRRECSNCARASSIDVATPPAGPMAHPIRPESYIKMDNFYTLTVYEKGGCPVLSPLPPDSLRAALPASGCHVWGGLLWLPARFGCLQSSTRTHVHTETF